MERSQPDSLLSSESLQCAELLGTGGGIATSNAEQLDPRNRKWDESTYSTYNSGDKK